MFLLTKLGFCLQCFDTVFWRQQEHPACKNWVMRCWCGYLSGARWRLFAYGPADATAVPKPHHLLPLTWLVSCFRYWLAHVVLEKRPLNSCSGSVVSWDFINCYCGYRDVLSFGRVFIISSMFDKTYSLAVIVETVKWWKVLFFDTSF